MKEEGTCRQEIRAYEKKIENWSCSVKSDHKGTTASSPKVWFSFPLVFMQLKEDRHVYIVGGYILHRKHFRHHVLASEMYNHWKLLEMIKSVEFKNIHPLICGIIV